ncbi:MAG: tripartite tricarboxylate transporter TctB family protein [Spirochaetaceae bacterium]|nr:MAG: tripartite tricarboxylate transporter TctB family protein [Spirochaetaceae bacterium]
MKDRLIGLGTMALAGLSLWDLHRTPARRFGMAVLSSTDFPIVVAWVLLGFGAILVAATFFAGRGRRVAGVASAGAALNTQPNPQPSDAPSPLMAQSSAERFRTLRRPAVLLAATIGYVFVIPILGFYPATACYLTGTVTAGTRGRARFLWALVITATTLALVYLVFHIWLRFFLPRGSVW